MSIFFVALSLPYPPTILRHPRVLDTHTPEKGETMKQFWQNRHREPNSDSFDAGTTVNGPYLAEIRSPEGATPRRREGALAPRASLVMNLKFRLAARLRRVGGAVPGEVRGARADVRRLFENPF